MTTDEELMDRYCAGDARAFDELFRRFAPRLLRFARTFVGAAHAQDIVQVTFLKAHENRHRYRMGAAVGPWLFTIARNTALDHVRAAPQRREVHVDADVREEAKVRDPFAAERVRAAVHELPADQRDVVLLYWFAELGFDEIADVMKTPSVTLRGRAHRAYEKLRTALADAKEPA